MMLADLLKDGEDKMAEGTFYNNVRDRHVVRRLPTGQDQLLIDAHTVHEVTSPQAFEEIEEAGLKVAHPELTFATLDHIIPTTCPSRPFQDPMAELMAETLERNCKKHGITYFGPGSGKQGVIHVTMPDQGLIWPASTNGGGDSHHCTNGGVSAIPFGVGTSDVRDILATQSIAIGQFKVRRINFPGELSKGVTSKDMALRMIRDLGISAGLGYVYEYSGRAVETLCIEDRMKLCNLTVEGGARSGYVNPDEVLFNWLKGRPFAPAKFDAMKSDSLSLRSRPDAVYDDTKEIYAESIEPMVTWGTDASQSTPIRGGRTPDQSKIDKMGNDERKAVVQALNYMGLKPGQELQGLPIDIVTIGSCTEGRLTDLVQAANIFRGKKVKVTTWVVPGSELIKSQAEKLGLDKIFLDAGAEWRYAGCSSCLGMNPDKVGNGQRCVSTSNRPYELRQGGGIYRSRTHLGSILTAAVSAITGRITDPRGFN